MLQSVSSRLAKQHVGAVLPVTQLHYKWALRALIAGVLQALCMGCASSIGWGVAAVLLHICLFGSSTASLQHEAQLKADREVLAEHAAACERWLLSAGAIRLAEAEFAGCAAALGIQSLAAKLQVHEAFFRR